MDTNEKSTMPTHFAPAERLSRQQVEEQTRIVESLNGMRDAVDALPHITMVLNQQRQIVFCNDSLLSAIGASEMGDVKGARPGEVLRCINAANNSGGCGTSESCQTCGAINAILNGTEGHKDCRECRITVKREQTLQSMDVRVTATPIQVDEQEFTILTLTDISGEKRRKALERIFFHDIMNTASGLRGLIELVEDVQDIEEAKHLIQTLDSIANTLVEEIAEQRDLIDAENHELKVVLAYVHSKALLVELASHYSGREQYQGRIVHLDESSEDVLFLTSPVLLRRVLKNMLKNALEATGLGEMVSAGCYVKDDYVIYWVKNPTVIPRDVQLQIFQRSFSTKGNGRGLGTYSMKLLTEGYLKGSISFTVNEEGTTFFAAYPFTHPDGEYME
ncbi:histidine kinase [Heliobacillus mobilis]|uniref:histidine kinase n=1 Tax=Heliobacterium mobile TaxID=28064 RepID=A0A6I3SRY7_HELMO|nr:HAMP domain-containing sensor histidine kinase [Heliobacterium mobile]MTV50817.1 histidine kinase [Heliobacterium mobile]